jgi:SAM-dependent methyltransferase
MPNICDYEGSDYKQRFWQNADRAYEDAVERRLLSKALPAKGPRIIEFGAGFGRLADLYTGHDQIVLFDYSRSLLEQAREKWGHDPRFRFVAGDLYKLPFGAGMFSTATMIRVIHHIADVPPVLAGIRKAMAAGGKFVMEFANKRNVKAMLRHAAGRQTWSPYDPAPIEFAKLNFDFHPAWMRDQLAAAGFALQRCVPVSHLRIHQLKRVLPLNVMVGLDGALQAVPVKVSPSVFTFSGVPGTAAAINPDFEAGLVSPQSGAPLRREGNMMVCDSDGTRWAVDGALYEFKTPC